MSHDDPQPDDPRHDGARPDGAGHDDPDEERRVLLERSRRYLLVGGLVTVGSIAYLLTVRESSLIVLALVVGVIDVAVGLSLRRRAGRTGTTSGPQ